MQIPQSYAMDAPSKQVKVQLDETAADILFRDNAKLYFQVRAQTAAKDSQ